MAKDLRSKLKEAFEKNKPAFVLVALLLLGGLAALTRLPGARGPIERRVKNSGGAPFAGKVEKWNAPTMRRSDPESMIKLGDGLVETSEGAAQAQGAPVADEAAAGTKKGRGAETSAPGEDYPPELQGGRAPGSARLQRVSGFDNKSQGPGGGGSAQSEGEGAGGLAGAGAAAAAAGGGAGPLSTLKRNLAILGRRAARMMGLGAGSGPGGAKSFAGGQTGPFQARPGGGADISGGDAIQRTGAGVQGSGLSLTRAPGGTTGGRPGGGSGSTTGSGPGGTEGGEPGPTGGTSTTSGTNTGTTSGTPKECEQNCKDKCAKAGKAGDALCLKECVRHERCDSGGAHPEPPSCPAPPEYFEPVPNRVDIVQMTAAAHPDWIKAACQPGHPDKEKFIDAVVQALRGDKTNRWGYVCKRGNCSNLSEDCVGYYAGPNPKQGGGEVIAIDVIRNCGEEDFPQWINWDCYHKGTRWTCARDGECKTRGPTADENPPANNRPPGEDTPPGGDGPGDDPGRPENQEI